ncbi:MAG: hypothetical protein ABI461_17405 [Polyangiaceae bacterium]
MSFAFFARAVAPFVLVLAAFVLLSGAARADDDAAAVYVVDDVVVLTNGNSVKGHVVYETAQSFLRMWLDDGKIVTIPWSEIDRVVLSSAKPTTPPRPWHVPEERAEQERDETVHVVFDADEGTILDQRSRVNGNEWAPVCTGKCSADLLLRADYRIRGGGARTSAPFRLEGKPSDTVVLTPKTHSRSGLGWGITLVSAGSIGVLAALAHASHCEEYDSACGHGTEGAWVSTSMISLAVSAFGTALIATHPKSKVLQHLGDGTPAAPAKSGALQHEQLASASVSRASDSWRRPLPAGLTTSTNSSTVLSFHF